MVFLSALRNPCRAPAGVSLDVRVALVYNVYKSDRKTKVYAGVTGMAVNQSMLQGPNCEDVPLPIVKLNRWFLLLGVLGGLVFQQPLVTTVLFLILLPATVFGQRFSLIFHTGSRLFAGSIPLAEREDRRLQRFNNTIATVLLGSAQVAFLAGWTTLGWGLSVAVAVAASVALAGFCVGCFLYYQFKLNRYRLLNKW